jgi:excisionase family DNA binding protein
MNKKDAAIYLGISTRTLEWHVKQKNIGARKVRGKTGEIADFDEGELRKLKARIDERRAPVHAVERVSHESHETEPRNMTGLARLSDVSPDQFMQMLAQAYTAGVSEVMQRLPAMLPAVPNGHAPAATPTIPVADKLTLSLVEASLVSGLSRNHLRAAIAEKKLRARIIGRGFRVKRSDLEAYVTKL